MVKSDVRQCCNCKLESVQSIRDGYFSSLEAFTPKWAHQLLNRKNRLQRMSAGKRLLWREAAEKKYIKKSIWQVARKELPCEQRLFLQKRSWLPSKCNKNLYIRFSLAPVVFGPWVTPSTGKITIQRIMYPLDSNLSIGYASASASARGGESFSIAPSFATGSLRSP